jgi:hypothetical protein
MTSELYLGAHKVHGEPAFDIMTRCECPECISMGCPECDDLGYWWIVPTSGHRAYPYWSDSLRWYMDEMCNVPECPTDLHDHYPHRAAPTISLTQALGLGKPAAPQPPLVRRI